MLYDKATNICKQIVKHDDEDSERIEGEYLYYLNNEFSIKGVLDIIDNKVNMVNVEFEVIKELPDGKQIVSIIDNSKTGNPLICEQYSGTPYVYYDKHNIYYPILYKGEDFKVPVIEYILYMEELEDEIHGEDFYEDLDYWDDEDQYIKYTNNEEYETIFDTDEYIKKFVHYKSRNERVHKITCISDDFFKYSIDVKIDVLINYGVYSGVLKPVIDFFINVDNIDEIIDITKRIQEHWFYNMLYHVFVQAIDKNNITIEDIQTILDTKRQLPEKFFNILTSIINGHNKEEFLRLELEDKIHFLDTFYGYSKTFDNIVSHYMNPEYINELNTIMNTMNDGGLDNMIKYTIEDLFKKNKILSDDLKKCLKKIDNGKLFNIITRIIHG